MIDGLGEGILEGIKNYIKTIPYCYILEGIVVSKNKDESYQVLVNNGTNPYNLFKYNIDDTVIYQPNDIVKVLVENNNTSQMYILCRTK